VHKTLKHFNASNIVKCTGVVQNLVHHKIWCTCSSAHERVISIFYGIARSMYKIARSWVPREFG